MAAAAEDRHVAATDELPEVARAVDEPGEEAGGDGPEPLLLLALPVAHEGLAHLLEVRLVDEARGGGEPAHHVVRGLEAARVELVPRRVGPERAHPLARLDLEAQIPRRLAAEEREVRPRIEPRGDGVLEGEAGVGQRRIGLPRRSRGDDHRRDEPRERQRGSPASRLRQGERAQPGDGADQRAPVIDDELALHEDRAEREREQRERQREPTRRAPGGEQHDRADDQDRHHARPVEQERGAGLPERGRARLGVGREVAREIHHARPGADGREQGERRRERGRARERRPAERAPGPRPDGQREPDGEARQRRGQLEEHGEARAEARREPPSPRAPCAEAPCAKCPCAEPGRDAREHEEALPDLRLPGVPEVEERVVHGHREQRAHADAARPIRQPARERARDQHRAQIDDPRRPERVAQERGGEVRDVDAGGLQVEHVDVGPAPAQPLARHVVKERLVAPVAVRERRQPGERGERHAERVGPPGVGPEGVGASTHGRGYRLPSTSCAPSECRTRPTSPAVRASTSSRCRRCRSWCGGTRSG